MSGSLLRSGKREFLRVIVFGRMAVRRYCCEGRPARLGLTGKLGLSREVIADRLGKFRFYRDARELAFPTGLEFF